MESNKLNVSLVILIWYPVILAAQTDTINDKIIAQSMKNRQRSYEVDNRIKGTGKIIEYGKPIIGYMFNVFDTLNYGKITAIESYVDGRRHGIKVQFFNYPDDTAPPRRSSEKEE